MATDIGGVRMDIKTAIKIVNLIIDDINNRQGIGREWRRIEDAIKREIKKEWVKILFEEG
jgi:hypothetical protein